MEPDANPVSSRPAPPVRVDPDSANHHILYQLNCDHHEPLPHPALPRTVSPERAALLAGRSRAAIVRAIEGGLLGATGRVHRRIRLADLETFLGRPVTLDDWTATASRYDRQRDLDALRNHRRHPAGTPRAANPGNSDTVNGSIPQRHSPDEKYRRHRATG